jgi:GTP-binding protein
MSTEAAGDAALREQGRLLFARPCTFFWAASDVDSLPPMQRPEIAFAGRSNVGKSSLINALTGQNALARTSHTPGRTQQLNFFNLGDELSLVDMPGYGYARVSKQKVADWTDLIHAYLRGRASLARVYVLIDSRHGIKTTDEAVLRTLDDAAVSYQIVLTKTDEVPAAALPARLAATLQQIARRPAAHPEVIATSSRKGEGIPDLRAAVAQLLGDVGRSG